MSVSHRAASAPTQRTPARLIRWLAAAGVVVVLLVTTTSALLRVSSAGLGCEDWPACYGRGATSASDGAQPPTLARMVHRIAASLAGGVVLGIGLLALTQPRRHRRELALFAVLAVVTVGLATLGRATPGALVPAVAMGNVLGGVLMASLLAWLALGERVVDARAPAWLRRLSGFALVLAFLTIGLGVMTSASYSGLACPSLPLCMRAGGAVEWSMADLHPWHTVTGSPSIHMAHRAAVLITGAVTVALALGLGRLDGRGRRLRRLLLAALAVQLALGVGLVILRLPLPVAVMHNLGAALLLISLVATQHRLSNRKITDARRVTTDSAPGPAPSGC